MDCRAIAVAKCNLFALGATILSDELNGFCERLTTFYIYDCCEGPGVREQVHEHAAKLGLEPGLYIVSLFKYEDQKTYTYSFNVIESVECTEGEEFVPLYEERYGDGEVYVKRPQCEVVQTIEPVNAIELAAV